MHYRLGIGIVLLAASAPGCSGRRHPVTSPVAPPAFLLGTFTDDYGSRYTIAPGEWIQHPRTRYRIVRWNVAGQYLVAQNDAANPADGGLWTRIDWLPLPGMPPYTWGFCYSAYRAPSAEVADTVSVANRATPRTGCNGYPFSRMRPIAADSVR